MCTLVIMLLCILYLSYYAWWSGYHYLHMIYWSFLSFLFSISMYESWNHKHGSSHQKLQTGILTSKITNTQCLTHAWNHKEDTPKASETCSFDLHGALYFSQNPRISLFSHNPPCTKSTRHAILAKKHTTRSCTNTTCSCINHKHDMRFFNPKPNNDLTIRSILPYTSEYLSIRLTGYKHNPERFQTTLSWVRILDTPHFFVYFLTLLIAHP
jgi:hypothetical protein